MGVLLVTHTLTVMLLFAVPSAALIFLGSVLLRLAKSSIPGSQLVLAQLIRLSSEASRRLLLYFSALLPSPAHANSLESSIAAMRGSGKISEIRSVALRGNVDEM